MPHTVQPIPADAPDFTDPAVLADHIERAADLIERDGKHEGGYWPLTVDDNQIWIDDTYSAQMPCCTVGAIAVTVGVDAPLRVDLQVLGHNPFTGDVRPHPVLAAVMHGLYATEVEQVFAWSDSARDDQVVARLRYIADQLRIDAETPAAVA